MCRCGHGAAWHPRRAKDGVDLGRAFCTMDRCTCEQYEPREPTPANAHPETEPK